MTPERFNEFREQLETAPGIGLTHAEAKELLAETLRARTWIDQALDKIGSVYQLVGFLADKANVFDAEEIQECLTHLSRFEDYYHLELPEYASVKAPLPTESEASSEEEA